MNADHQLVCALATGEDRDAGSDDEMCGYEPDGALDWMNHTDLDHRGHAKAVCSRCGEMTEWSERMLPTVDFFNGNESVGVCLDCQHELYDALRGAPDGGGRA